MVNEEKIINELSKKIDSVNNNIGSFKQYVANQINEIKNSIEEIHVTVNSNKTEIDQNKTDLSQHKHEIEALKTQNKELNAKLCKMNDNLEDSQNRTMRETLVFTNVPEEKNETWDKTTQILISKLKIIDPTLAPEDIEQDIDRAHRGGKPRQDKPRPIFVKFSSWKKNSEYYKRITTNYNVKNPQANIMFVEQLYTKELTDRRNQAKLERKHLRENGEHGKMFIKYPAKLMVKRNNSNKYELVQEF